MEYRRHSYHRKPRKKRQNRVTVPARVGPHVKLVFSEMHRQRKTYDEVEQGSGVLRSTLKAWRVKNRPGLETLEAVFGFLGFDFIPIPSEQALPPRSSPSFALSPTAWGSKCLPPSPWPRRSPSAIIVWRPGGASRLEPRASEREPWPSGRAHV